MTHVVTEDCTKCVPRRCVVACPVDCFHEGPDSVVIDPQACIDCAECVIECPLDAIVDVKQLSPSLHHAVARNATLALLWPVLAMPPGAAHSLPARS